MNKLKRLLYSQKIAPYVYVLPFVLTFLIFFVYPLTSTIRMSFQDILPGQVSWVGTKNYGRLLGDKVFMQAVFNSVRYMVITCALLIPFPMLFAYMISSRSMKFGDAFKSIYFVPVLSSVVVAGLIFRMMFSELPGALMNSILALFGKPAIYWLKLEYPSLLALVLLCCWRWTGMNMLYYLAGIKAIPQELYEAADIDGASATQKFLKIGWPLLKPTTIYVLTISIYAGLAMFTESYMVFGNNTSPHNYGLTIVGYLYRYGFEKLRMGYASAVGLVLLVGAMVINLVQLRLTGTIRGRRRRT
jgi:arabinosaccharide transport system permease protein